MSVIVDKRKSDFKDLYWNNLSIKPQHGWVGDVIDCQLITETNGSFWTWHGTIKWRCKTYKDNQGNTIIKNIPVQIMNGVDMRNVVPYGYPRTWDFNDVYASDGIDNNDRVVQISYKMREECKTSMLYLFNQIKQLHPEWNLSENGDGPTFYNKIPQGDGGAGVGSSSESDLDMSELKYDLLIGSVFRNASEVSKALPPVQTVQFNVNVEDVNIANENELKEDGFVNGFNTNVSQI